jgi:hypothetical protein
MYGEGRKRRWPGQAVGWSLFIFVGLPWSALFMLGERACDMHIGPPCAIGWGTTKLINFVVVIVCCTFAGWATNKLVRLFLGSDSES